MEYDISSTVSLVSHIHSLSADFLRSRLNQLGLPELSSSHGFILFLLSKESELTMGEIARRINRDKSTTTVLVRKLENGGFVQSYSNASDARSKIIKLTEKGNEYNDATSKLSSELIHTFYKGFSAEEKTKLLSFLQRIADNF